MKDKWWIFLVIGVVVLLGVVAYVSVSLGRQMGRAEARLESEINEGLDSETQQRIESALENMGSEIESALGGAGSEIESALNDAGEDLSNAFPDTNSDWNTDTAEGESTLTAETDFADASITNVEVNWVVGNITILAGDHVSLKEYSAETVADQDRIEYTLNGTALVINEYPSTDMFSFGSANSDRVKKDLVLTLPGGLSELRLNIVVGNVTTEEGISAGKIELNGVSSQISLANLEVKEFEINVVDAAITLDYAAAPEEIDVESVGGSVSITLPEGSGFTADIESVSGKLTTPEGTARGNGILTSGNGAVNIEIQTVSGEVEVTVGK
ncbi:MAG: DUF4097 family beta strand repeat protein [Firmicutes bacterium]|nr:DUF4097 family beta strand repeat protein [Bacillota bacterium]